MQITVLGIGNLLLKDEGFGIHVIRHLENRTIFPAGVKLVDGGTAGMYMASVLEECDRLIVVDVLALDSLPGTICTLSGKEMQGGNVQLRMSPHQLGFLEIMSLCELRGESPDLVEFIGIVPFDLNVGTELSDLLASKVEVVAAMVENRLKEWLHA
ncbi:MAG: HyaD/HybD family hydrogenase maturation endopeptidase [Thermodesulfobacteriota bacterium]